MGYFWPNRTALVWINLIPYWSEIQRFNRQMAREKNHWQSTRLANPYPDLLGKAGEYAYAIRTGLSRPKTWVKLGLNDGGVDCGGADVKAVRFLGYECEYFLKLPNLRFEADVLALAVVDPERQRADILGTISREGFRAKAQLRTFSEVMGPQYVVSEADLETS